MIDFPNSPTAGQQFSAAGVNWTWDGVKWTAAADVAYLPLAGGTMLGPLTLGVIRSTRSTRCKHMRISMRGQPHHQRRHADRPAQQRRERDGDQWLYGDRWRFDAAQAGKGTWQRRIVASIAAIGFPYYLNFSSSSAYTPLAADLFLFRSVYRSRHGERLRVGNIQRAAGHAVVLG